MSKPRARRATALPIAPMPTMPSVAPYTSDPSHSPGCQRPQLPARVSASDATTCRATASISANARSAVVSSSTFGVLDTSTSRPEHVATSTLLYPTAMFATTFSVGAAFSSAASTRSEIIVMTATHPSARAASSSGAGGS